MCLDCPVETGDHFGIIWNVARLCTYSEKKHIKHKNHFDDLLLHSTVDFLYAQVRKCLFFCSVSCSCQLILLLLHLLVLNRAETDPI